MLQNKDTRLHIRTSTEQLRRLARASELLDMPTSELVRRLIDEKLEKLSKRYPELEKEAA
jgi:hypothetical protein